jgi:hypothetical protein
MLASLPRCCDVAPVALSFLCTSFLLTVVGFRSSDPLCFLVDIFLLLCVFLFMFV